MDSPEDLFELEPDEEPLAVENDDDAPDEDDASWPD